MSNSGVPRPRTAKAPASTIGSKLIGQSPAFRALIAELDEVAADPTAVLLLGEVGTGKSQLAEYLHERSGRTGPFVAINCPSIVESLADSLLFGHRAGTFTGAQQAHLGYFAEAQGGTLFLDEIGDLSPSNQGRLLQALQTGLIRPVGARGVTPVDVRIVAATNRSLPDLVSRGLFRDDLLSRLNHYPVIVPPLRERGRDVVLIGRNTLATHPALARRQPLRLSRDGEDWLMAQCWPHNIREVDATIVRAGYKARGGVVGAQQLGQAAAQAAAVAVALRGELVVERSAPTEPAAPVLTLPAREVELPVVLPHRFGALALELARRRQEGIAPRDLMAEGLSESTAGRVLDRMVEAGLMRHNGAFGKAVRYRAS